ncbi:hypothetical protein M422DRAFT_247929 [Sphaerobolus stellatus SS14]|nr:hypothetical protein M422DRAFT_247929 [Sphaerobolus stellatus SS14]
MMTLSKLVKDMDETSSSLVLNELVVRTPRQILYKCQKIIYPKEALRFFQGWLNDAAARFGGRQIDGLPRELDEIQRVWTTARFGNPIFSANALNDFNESSSNEVRHLNQIVSEDEYQDFIEDLVFNDYY